MSKKILLCVTGLTPQVVTETVYALSQRDTPWIPDEIHLLTSGHGAEHARLTLFVEEGGWFHRLRREYSLPPIDFTERHIHVIRDDRGEPLEDIRTEADNRYLADAITHHVRHWCMQPDTELHVSLAGGRKTMSFFAGYVLSLFGRPQDRLSHVLVEPKPFESHPAFFFPTTASSPIRDRDGRIMDRAHARVQLADVPFLRLQPVLDQQILAGAETFESLISRLQQNLSGTRPLVFDMEALQVRVGDMAVQMSPINFLFYSWLAWRHLQEREPVPIPPNEDVPGDAALAEDLARWIETYRPNHHNERTLNMLERDGLSHAFIRDRKTRINKALKQALGLGAKPYLLVIPRGSHRVLMQLDRQLIHFDAGNIARPD